MFKIFRNPVVRKKIAVTLLSCGIWKFYSILRLSQYKVENRKSNWWCYSKTTCRQRMGVLKSTFQLKFRAEFWALNFIKRFLKYSKFVPLFSTKNFPQLFLGGKILWLNSNKWPACTPLSLFHSFRFFWLRNFLFSEFPNL